MISRYEIPIFDSTPERSCSFCLSFLIGFRSRLRRWSLYVASTCTTSNLNHDSLDLYTNLLLRINPSIVVVAVRSSSGLLISLIGRMCCYNTGHAYSKGRLPERKADLYWRKCTYLFQRWYPMSLWRQ